MHTLLRLEWKHSLEPLFPPSETPEATRGNLVAGLGRGLREHAEEGLRQPREEVRIQAPRSEGSVDVSGQ